MVGYASDFEWSSSNWELLSGASYDGTKALSALNGNTYARNNTVADALNQKVKVYFAHYHTNLTNRKGVVRVFLRHSQLGTNNSSNVGYLLESAVGYDITNYVKVYRCDGNNAVELYSTSGLTKGVWYLLDFRVMTSGSNAYIAAYIYKQSDMSLIRSIEITDTSPLNTPGKFGFGLYRYGTSDYARLDNLEYYVL